VAEIKVPTTVTGPDQITVALVRGDYMDVSNVFRVLFEVFLSISATLLGVVLSIPSPTTLHFVFLTVIAVAGVTFLVLTVIYHRKAGAPGRAAGSAGTATPGTGGLTIAGFAPTVDVSAGKKHPR